MRAFVPLLAVLLVAGTAAGETPAADLRGQLSEARARLVESTREYRASLEGLLRLQEEEERRAAAVTRQRTEQFQRGLVSRRQVEESERVSQEASARTESTRQRLAETDTVLAETLAAAELAKLPPPAPEEEAATPRLIRFHGTMALEPSGIDALHEFFVSRFGRPLPVSARGQTPVHDRLGLDHRHALDVAVHPDSVEGHSLLGFLRSRRIPFLAFRQAVPGASTGPHVHIGPPSERVVPGTAADRAR